MRFAALLVLVCACDPAHLQLFQLDKNEHQEIAGTDLEVAWVSGKLQLRSISEHRVLDQIDAARGRLDLPLEGRTCWLNVPYLPKTGPLKIEIACSDGPTPGTAGAMSGNGLLDWLPWALPGLVLGVVAGLFRRSRRPLALAAAVLSAGLAITLPIVWFGSWFRLTHAIAFTGYAFGGVLLGNTWLRRKGGAIAGLIGGVLAVAGVCFFGSKMQIGYALPIATMVFALLAGWGMGENTDPKRRR